MSSPGSTHDLALSDHKRVRRTMASVIAIELHKGILRGDYPAGSWLRIQEIAKQHTTSMMPVREALRQLDALGLVEIVPYRGARVVELSADDLEDTYRTRRAIEAALVGLAAARFTPTDAHEAGEALRAHEHALAAGKVEEARRAHTDFHFRIYQASGSRWLVRSAEPVWRNSERYRFTAPDNEITRDCSHEEHGEILAACADGDVVRARAAIERHLDAALARIKTAMLL